MESIERDALLVLLFVSLVLGKCTLSFLNRSTINDVSASGILEFDLLHRTFPHRFRYGVNRVCEIGAVSEFLKNVG